MFQKVHIQLKFLSLLLLTTTAPSSANPLAAPIIPHIQEQYPLLGCARSTRRFAQQIRWGRSKGRSPFRVDAWDEILTYELRQTRQRIQVLEAEDPLLLDRLKRIRTELPNADKAGLTMRRLFPYALDVYEPSVFWWKHLEARGYRIRPMTIENLREWPIAEFSKMLVDFDFTQILVNTHFDFDMWLPSREASNVIDPDTTLVQALASAYFQEVVAAHPTEEYVEYLRQLARTNPEVNAAIRVYEKRKRKQHYWIFSEDAWIVLREKWALERQMEFYFSAKARGWPVHSPVLDRIGQMLWEAPPPEFLRAFAFYHEVEVDLANALWNEKLPTSLMPASPQQLPRRPKK